MTLSILQGETGGFFTFDSIEPTSVSGYVDVVDKKRVVYRFDGYTESGVLYVPKQQIAGLDANTYIVVPQTVDSEGLKFFMVINDLEVLENPAFTGTTYTGFTLYEDLEQKINNYLAGIDNSNFVLESDLRLSDARVPVVHANTHSENGVDPVFIQSNQVTDLISTIISTIVAGSNVTITVNPDNTITLSASGGSPTTDAGDLTTGTLSDSRLSSNVVRKNEAFIEFTVNGMTFNSTGGTFPFVFNGHAAAVPLRVVGRGSDFLPASVAQGVSRLAVTAVTPQVGFGLRESISLQTNSSSGELAQHDDVTWTDVNNSTRTASRKISLTRQGVMTDSFQLDFQDSSTQSNIWIRHNGSFKRVLVGAADSGGTGFRLLRIAN